MTGKIIEKVFYLATSWQKTSTLTDKDGFRHTITYGGCLRRCRNCLPFV